MAGVSDFGRGLRTAIQQDLKHAMRSGDAVELRAIRSVLSTIDNAEAVDAAQVFDPSLPRLGETEVPRRSLDLDEVRRLLEAELEGRQRAAGQYRDAGRHDAAEELDREAAVVQGYLDGLPER